MLAATYVKKNKIVAKSQPFPIIGTNEALVKIFSTGICGSDLAIISGSHPRAKPPLVIGHEFAGEIIELNKPGKSNLRTGNKVTLYPLISCGNCYACRNGLSHVCSSLKVIGFDRDGGLAEYVSLPVDMLVKIPDSMSYEEGSLIEPLSVAVHSVNMISVSPDDQILVLGAGPIGLLTAMVLKCQGADNLYISDINKYRLQIAKSLGLITINSLDTDIYKFIKDKTNGDMTDIVFEVAGVQESAEQMIDLVRPRGIIINVSVFKKHPNIDMRSINFRELTIIGSRVYTRDDFKKAIDLSSHLPLTDIVSHRLPLSDVTDAFRLHKEEENVCKVILNPHGIQPTTSNQI